MDEQIFTQLINFIREWRVLINNSESTFSPAELSANFIHANVDNTGELWQALFNISDEIKATTDLYDNAESGFFLGLSDGKKNQIYTSLIYTINSLLNVTNRIQVASPSHMNNTDFFGIEEHLEVCGRAKQFLIDNNLYTI